MRLRRENMSHVEETVAVALTEPAFAKYLIREGRRFRSLKFEDELGELEEMNPYGAAELNKTANHFIEAERRFYLASQFAKN